MKNLMFLSFALSFSMTAVAQSGVQINAPETFIQGQSYENNRFDLPVAASPELKKLKDELTSSNDSFVLAQKDLADSIQRLNPSKPADAAKLKQVMDNYDQRLLLIEEKEAEYVVEKDMFLDNKIISKLPEEYGVNPSTVPMSQGQSRD